MYQNCCKKCGSIDLHTEVKGNNTGLYCNDCGAWIKWLGKDELRAFEYANKHRERCSDNRQEYNNVKNNKEQYDDWYVGLVGFGATFGAKWFGGYARGFKSDGVTPRDESNEAIRNIIKQAPNLKNITFQCCDFRDINDIENFVIYCDIPYKNTTKYVTNVFPYEEFYDWCKKMSKYNIVLISEYNMPPDFECIWSKETIVNFDSNRMNNGKDNNRTEKLFICKNNC